MKHETGTMIRLGVFITLGIAVFIFGIYFIGERQQIFRKTIRVSGVFRDVVGLQEGNNVRLSGVNVGTVDNIRIVSDSSVRVTILIGEHARQFIKKDAVASIGSDGLMGNRILIVSPGTGGKEFIEDNDTVGTVQPVNVDDIMTSLKATLDNTTRITGGLASITENIQSGRGTIGRLLMSKPDAQQFDSTLANLREGSAEFRLLMQKTKRSWLLWGF
jgi:phospholipid/cholesterol/gamma-HCH transport system substrate-binding protein